MTTNSLISREEALGGMPGRDARRASALLTLITAQTAYLVAQSQQAMAEFLTEQGDAESSRAFLDAIALGREPPVPPTIQDVERWAPLWAALLPDNPATRANLARLLGQRYRFTRQATPQLQAALGAGTPAVREAFARLHGAPIETIFADAERPAERWRWLRARMAARLEDLPPFWTAFALALTNTIGSSVLALPIALARIGPLAGVGVLVLLGLVNVLTIAWIAEAFGRTGSIRYGRVFMSRIVTEYLGRSSGIARSVATLVYCVLALFAYYLGFSTTLAASTPIPAWVWVALLFLVNVYYVRRKTISATVASALVVGAASIVLILLLSLLAFTQARAANLAYVALPGVGGRPFDSTLLQLVFGVVLTVYSGHLALGNCAQVTLRRDPSGRALIRGASAALLASIVLFCIWVVAVNGAIAPETLARETGTALVPLAAQFGTPVRILGTIYVLLAIGLISVHAALNLFGLTREVLSPLRIGERWRPLLHLAPMTVIVLLTEWMLISQWSSFAQITSLRGALAAPVLVGTLPTLLVLAARRKGEVALPRLRGWLGSAWLVGAIYVVFLASIVLHGLVLWQDWPRRSVALLTAALLVWMSIRLWRQGALADRVVAELRHDTRKGRASAFGVVAGGAPLDAGVQLHYAAGERQFRTASGAVPEPALLRAARFSLPAGTARSLKVWAHRVAASGESAGLPGRVIVRSSQGEQSVDIPANGQVVLPIGDGRLDVEIVLEK
jgi:amino acid permease